MDRSVVTIGTFDGVHAGHAALVRRARAIADAGGARRVVALVFDPHPLTRLRPGSVPARLSTFAQRTAWLRALGADLVVRLEPTPELLGQSPEEFARSLARDYSPHAVVEGPDFRFGHGRAGDVGTLGALGRGLGFTVEVVEPVTVALGDHTMVTASSTIIRWLVENGRVGDAARVLGGDHRAGESTREPDAERAYEMVGTVVRGERRGRTLGFPTANLDSPCLAPGDGVYAASAELEDGRCFLAAASVGSKPTFHDGPIARAVEAFLIDAPLSSGGDAHAGPAIAGLPEYGWSMRLRFAAWVRDQLPFESVPALVEQMARDTARVREILSRAPCAHREVAGCP